MTEFSGISIVSLMMIPLTMMPFYLFIIIRLFRYFMTEYIIGRLDIKVPVYIQALLGALITLTSVSVHVLVFIFLFGIGFGGADSLIIESIILIQLSHIIAGGFLCFGYNTTWPRIPKIVFLTTGLILLVIGIPTVGIFFQ